MSGKQACVYWLTPAGNYPDETNWRAFSEIELFSVPKDVFEDVRARIIKLEAAYDRAYDIASSIAFESNNLVELEFDFEPETRRFVCRSNESLFVTL